MKKKNIIIIAAVAAVCIVALIVALHGSRKATFKQNYHIEDTASITRLFLADKQEGEVLLTRVGDSTWLVDEKYPANQPMVDLFLETLHSMEGYPKTVSFVWNLLLAFVLCYVMELLLSLVQTKLPDTRKPWAVFLKEWVKNSYLTNIVLLPLLAVITIVLMNAMLHGRHYQLTLIFTAVVLVVEARNIYKAAITALRVKHNWAFLRNSLIP